MQIMKLSKEDRTALKNAVQELERCGRKQRDYLESKIVVLETVDHEVIKEVMGVVLSSNDEQADYIKERYEDYGLSSGLFLQAYSVYLKQIERSIV